MKIPRALVIITLSAGLGVFVAVALRSYPLVTRLGDGRLVPPWGLAVNPNPVKEEHIVDVTKKLHVLHQGILAFREKTGRLPTAPRELIGIKLANGTTIGESHLKSPYYAMSDRAVEGNEDYGYSFELLANRPDGSKKPVRPKPGEKDAWVTTGEFTRKNAILYPNWTSKRSPGGEFLVLWSDGTVERIPYEKLCWVEVGRSLEAHFPGQTGMPEKHLTNRDLASLEATAVPGGLGNPKLPTSSAKPGL